MIQYLSARLLGLISWGQWGGQERNFTTSINVAPLSSIGQSSGELVHKHRLCGPGFLFRCVDGFMSLSSRGELSLYQVDKRAMSIQFQDKLFRKGRVWSVPAICDHTIFVRAKDAVRRFDLNLNPLP